MIFIYGCPDCGADVERKFENGYMCMATDKNGYSDSCGLWEKDELVKRPRDEKNVPIRTGSR